jgi:type IV pilus assembly protein PilA
VQVPSAIRTRFRSHDDGFTLIELLVVVVIIGILIAIAIPLYLNYEKGAQNKSAASDVRGAISTVEQCYSDSSTQLYPTSWTAAAGFGGCATPSAVIKISSGNTLIYNPNSTTTPATYSVVGYHGTSTSNNGVWYCYSSAAGGSVKTETGTIPTTYQSAC